MIRKLIRWSAYPLISFPIIVAFVFVHEFGVNVVFRDQWEMVTRFRGLFSDTLSASDLWKQHNQHRSVFPRIVMLALGALTRWNNIAEMYLILVCMLAILLVLFLLFMSSGEDGAGVHPLLFVPIAFLVFSLRQHWNMLLGYQLNFVFAATFGVLAFYLLHLSLRGRFRKLSFPTALASATVAAFSAIQGLLVWPVGLLQLLIAPVGRRTKEYLIPVWVLVGLVEWAAYFVGHENTSPSSPLYPLTHPLSAMKHLLTLLGSSFFFPQQQSLALISGTLLAILIVAAMFLGYKSDRRDYSFWVATLSFSLLTLGSITVGRSGRGMENALASKYTTFSLLVVASVYAILVISALDQKPRVAVASAGILAAIVLVSIPLSYDQGISAGSASRDAREEASCVLLTYGSQSDERLEILNQRPQNVRERAPILEDLDYNVFAANPELCGSRSLPRPSNTLLQVLHDPPGL